MDSRIDVGLEKSAVPAQNAIVAIDHIAIAVVDIGEAINWYVKCLGFKLVEERTTTGERTAMLSAVLTAGESVVVLVQGTSPESQVSRFIQQYGPGVQHIAFRVENLQHTMSRALASGAAADTSIIEGDRIRQLFLRRDSGSGVRVELIEKNGGAFSDTTVAQLFAEFENRDLV